MTAPVSPDRLQELKTLADAAHFGNSREIDLSDGIAELVAEVQRLQAERDSVRAQWENVLGALGEVSACAEAALAALARVTALVPEFETRFGIQSSPVSLLRAALAADPKAATPNPEEETDG